MMKGLCQRKGRPDKAAGRREGLDLRSWASRGPWGACEDAPAALTYRVQQGQGPRHRQRGRLHSGTAPGDGARGRLSRCDGHSDSRAAWWPKDLRLLSAAPSLLHPRPFSPHRAVSFPPARPSLPPSHPSVPFLLLVPCLSPHLLPDTSPSHHLPFFPFFPWSLAPPAPISSPLRSPWAPPVFWEIKPSSRDTSKGDRPRVDGVLDVWCVCPPPGQCRSKF